MPSTRWPRAVMAHCGLHTPSTQRDGTRAGTKAMVPACDFAHSAARAWPGSTTWASRQGCDAPRCPSVNSGSGVSHLLLARGDLRWDSYRDCVTPSTVRRPVFMRVLLRDGSASSAAAFQAVPTPPLRFNEIETSEDGCWDGRSCPLRSKMRPGAQCAKDDVAENRGTVAVVGLVPPRE
jgi:hypothetical protein